MVPVSRPSNIEKFSTFLLTNTKYIHESIETIFHHLQPKFIPLQGEVTTHRKSILLAAASPSLILAPSIYEQSEIRAAVSSRWEWVCEWFDLLIQYCIASNDPSSTEDHSACLVALDLGFSPAVRVENSLRAPLIMTLTICMTLKYPV